MKIPIPAKQQQKRREEDSTAQNRTERKVTEVARSGHHYLSRDRGEEVCGKEVEKKKKESKIISLCIPAQLIKSGRDVDFDETSIGSKYD